jgi:hypothetical protein
MISEAEMISSYVPLASRKVIPLLRHHNRARAVFVFMRRHNQEARRSGALFTSI